MIYAGDLMSLKLAVQAISFEELIIQCIYQFAPSLFILCTAIVQGIGMRFNGHQVILEYRGGFT